jgi:hypothetical protein
MKGIAIQEVAVVVRREVRDPGRGAERRAVDREQDQRENHREDDQRALAGGADDRSPRNGERLLDQARRARL